MSDEELIARLQNRTVFGTPTATAAADRIEALTAKLAKAVEIGDKMAKSIEGNYYIPGVVKEWRATLAEIKGESHE